MRPRCICDPDLALEQLRSLVDFPVVKSFIMSRGITSEYWGDALWQEVVLTDGRRLIIWRADDGSTGVDDDDARRHLDASVRTILLSTITDHRRQRQAGSNGAAAAIRARAVAVGVSAAT
jgi:hypothetical protein